MNEIQPTRGWLPEGRTLPGFPTWKKPWEDLGFRGRKNINIFHDLTFGLFFIYIYIYINIYIYIYAIDTLKKNCSLPRFWFCEMASILNKLYHGFWLGGVLRLPLRDTGSHPAITNDIRVFFSATAISGNCWKWWLFYYEFYLLPWKLTLTGRKIALIFW